MRSKGMMWVGAGMVFLGGCVVWMGFGWSEKLANAGGIVILVGLFVFKIGTGWEGHG